MIPWLKPFVERNSADSDSNEDRSIIEQKDSAENKDFKSEGLKRKFEDNTLETEETATSSCPASKLIKLEKHSTEQDNSEIKENDLKTITTKTETIVMKYSCEGTNENSNKHSSKISESSSKTHKENKKKKKVQNPDFEITTVKCQAPLVKTVEKGHKDKKNKKKKKKQKNK